VPEDSPQRKRDRGDRPAPSDLESLTPTVADMLVGRTQGDAKPAIGAGDLTS
jgi:hypothetical protein